MRKWDLKKLLDGHPSLLFGSLNRHSPSFVVFYSEPKSGYSFTQKISEFCLCTGHCLRHANNFFLVVLLSTLEQWFSTRHGGREQFLLPTRTTDNVQRLLVGPGMLLNIPSMHSTARQSQEPAAPEGNSAAEKHIPLQPPRKPFNARYFRLLFLF